MKLSQNATPLFTAMEKYVADGAQAYHTPGHKQGRGIHKNLLKAITPYGLQMEVSLMEELDDIHGATHCLKDAQVLAAELFGAQETAFCINGTTGAIHAMMMAAVEEGEEILIPRNAHSSVLGGLILTGAKPIYLDPEVKDNLGMATNVSVEAVAKALQEHPNIKAMVLVHPNYYGVAADIKKIVEMLHEKNIPLLVDEAHGAHFSFSEELPITALEAGADMVAQSTHKLLGSMTQTSMLHFNSRLISLEKFRDTISLLQSTSPNYLLLASLDLARQQMALEGAKLWARVIKLTKDLRQKINTLPGLSCFGSEILNDQGAYGIDCTKITVDFRGLGLTGPEAEHILRYDHKIQCELSDAYGVLFLHSYADDEFKINYLYEALAKMSSKYYTGEHKNMAKDNLPLPARPALVFTPKEAVSKKAHMVKFTESVNKVAGERISFYPPGIPLIYPGERISQDLIDYVSWRLNKGANLKGPQDENLDYIRVLEE